MALPKMSSAHLEQALQAKAATVNFGGDTSSASDEPEKNLPMRKRKKGAGTTSPEHEDMHDTAPRKRGRPKGSTKKGRDEDDDFGVKAESDKDAVGGFIDAQTAAGTDDLKPIKRPPMSKAREIRLEQNRKAARESRKRKKVMVEELQRSVIFFSRANGTLKQQNDELQRMLVQAQTQLLAIEQNGGSAAANQAKEAEAQPGPADAQATPAPGAEVATATATAPAPGEDGSNPADAQQAVSAAQAAQQPQAQAQAQAAQAAAAQFQFQNMAQAQAQAAQAATTQAMFESQGYPPAAARAAAQTLVAQGGAVPAPGGTPAPSPADGSAAAPTPAAASMAANPFMAAMMGVQSAASQAPGAADPAPGTPAPAFGTTTPHPMDALNQFAMQQQFAAQLGAMGAAVPGVPAAAATNPALFQQQAAAMQLAAAGGQWGSPAGGQWGAQATAAGVPASGVSIQQQHV